MMTAASAPGLDAENRQLRAEVEQLREDLMREVALNRKLVAEFKTEMYDALERVNHVMTTDCIKRIKVLEAKRLEDSPAIMSHIEFLVKWLRDHEDTRDGITYEEAADLLHVVPSRMSQLKDTITTDKRLKVGKLPGKNRLMCISLA